MEQPQIETDKEIEKELPDGLRPLNWPKLMDEYEKTEEAKKPELVNEFYELYLKKLEKGEEVSFEFSEISGLGEIRKFLGDTIREKIGDPNLNDVETIVGELIGNLIRHGEGKGGNIILKLTPDRFYFAVRNKAEDLFEESRGGDLNFKARNNEEKSKIEKINRDIHECFNIAHIEVSEGAEGGKIEKYVFISKVDNYGYAGLADLGGDLNFDGLSEEEKKIKEQEVDEALKKMEDRGQGIGLSACLMNKPHKKHKEDDGSKKGDENQDEFEGGDEFIIIVERNDKGVSEWVTMGINRDRYPNIE